MAMRLYTASELEEELKTKWKLTKTNVVVAEHCIWKTPQGKHIPFPDVSNGPGGNIWPDHVVDKLAERLSELGENPCDKKK